MLSSINREKNEKLEKGVKEKGKGAAKAVPFRSGFFIVETGFELIPL